jgi:NTE family protein
MSLRFAGSNKFILWIIALSALICISCAAQYPLNPKQESMQPPERVPEPAGSQLLILAFSGGGTRAASLSYGTLEALRKIELPGGSGPGSEGPPRTMLDEVSIIVSVSGGSFTAAYYGLYGKQTFVDYREKFLTRDVQGYLTSSLFNPLNWTRLSSPRFGRSDLAQEYYDEILFKKATLADMERKNSPQIVILSTDLTDGVTVPFTRDAFGTICSDFARFPVSRAVAASSALPGFLSPVIVRNYAGSCGLERPDWVTKALEKPDPSSRLFQMARIFDSFLDERQKPYFYLVDGGVSDNLGIRAILDRIMMKGGLREVLERAEAAGVRRIAFIIVDAEVSAKPSWGLGDIPGLGAVLDVSSTVMVNKYNFEMLDLLRRTIRDWQAEDAARHKPLDFYIVHVTFDSLPEKKDRDYFHSIPTTLSLSAEQVDRLREAAATLLWGSPEFQRLIRDMGGKRLQPPG